MTPPHCSSPALTLALCISLLYILFPQIKWFLTVYKSTFIVQYFSSEWFTNFLLLSNALKIKIKTAGAYIDIYLQLKEKLKLGMAKIPTEMGTLENFPHSGRVGDNFLLSFLFGEGTGMRWNPHPLLISPF